jgi:hypothetical protein
MAKRRLVYHKKRKIAFCHSIHSWGKPKLYSSQHKFKTLSPWYRKG